MHIIARILGWSSVSLAVVLYLSKAAGRFLEESAFTRFYTEYGDLTLTALFGGLFLVVLERYLELGKRLGGKQ